jgi:ATP/maltotriose-dependent transcriptional regulator MalT/DNA-binding SARP family transcriptional activator
LLVRRKLLMPLPPDHLVRRPRLDGLLRGLVDRHRVVLVCATAGAGKSTTVAQALGGSKRQSGLDRPVAWLSVDGTDVSPGRLLTYLEAALTTALPGVPAAATSALPAGISHPEAAALLAEAVGDRPVVVVLDDLERLGDERPPWAVIESLARYAPDGMRLVLLSRREIPTTVCALPTDRPIAAVHEADLAFTPAEAAQALANLGAGGLDAGAAVEATAGWVTGVLFEAWRSDEHVTGAGGEADPLHGYLASHILGKLDAADRDFLVATSLLDEVNALSAEALGLRDASVHLRRLRAARIPVTWDGKGRSMRPHPRFREYLVDRLESGEPDDLRRLRLAYGQLLARDGHPEEATEQFLRAGALEHALRSAELSIISVIERLDLDIAERWLAALAPVRGEGGATGSIGTAADPASTAPDPISTAELMLAVVRDDCQRAARVADRLEATGERARLAGASDLTACLMGWAYLHQARLDDVAAVLAAAKPGPGVDAVRYATWLLADLPGETQPVPPEPTGTALDALPYFVSYFFGRLSALEELPPTRWAQTLGRPIQIAQVRALGHTDQALALYREALAAGDTNVVLHASVGPEVLLDAGLLDEAREAIAHGRKLALASGSIGYQALNAVAAAKFALRVEKDPEAAQAVLDRLDRDPDARRFHAIAAYLDVWYGLALLRRGEDVLALERLRRAVEVMVAGDRILELPIAAVYLAEAQWRAGDEDAADDAAELALRSAQRQGSNHLLLQALADFPAVVSRRIDAQARADSAWHDLGRALGAQGVSVQSQTTAASVWLTEFGDTAVTVNNQQVKPRIAKTYQLLAYLCASGRHGAQREELLDVLFDGRADDSARAYLRQAVRQLRVLLPDEVEVTSQDAQISLSTNVRMGSDSAYLESALAGAARLQGAARLTATLDALALYDRGPYLPKASSGWVDNRRAHLAKAATDARHDAAKLAFGLGRFTHARALNSATLDANPYDESAWQLRMRIANALGDVSAVLDAFRGCERALAELGTTPSRGTRTLLEDLRA